MFDFLKPNKVDLTVRLDRPSAVYNPGDAVRASVTVTAQKDLTVQEGRIVLLCCERFQKKSVERQQDDDGTSTSVNTSWQTNNEEFGREVFLSEGVVPGGATQTYTFTAQIPPDARPTWLGGKIVERTWLVKATLDRKLAADVNSEAPLFVTSVAPGLLAAAGSFGRSNAFGEVGLSFSLPGKEWVLGDTVAGEFQINPIKDVDVNDIRVELERVENVPQDRGNTYRDARTAKLAGKTSLRSGQPLALPFSLLIAAPSPTSGRTANYSVTWLLRGVLTRGLLKSDYAIEEELSVYSARRA
jgi:hypothetical protein